MSVEYDNLNKLNSNIININKEKYHDEIGKNIYDILKQCIDNRKQYLDTRLKEITNNDNLKDICQKYIKHHNNDKQDSNDKN